MKVAGKIIGRMGMPITSYSVLTKLAYGGELYETRAAKKSVEPFKLFAFIIHDPAAHSDFERELRFHFDLFDFITGRKLLFFALVDPPTEWLRHAGERAYYRELISWEAKELLNPTKAIVSSDRSITAFSLANALKIPTEMLPCIIVTDDFNSESFIWIKTCSRHIEEQLQRLGYLATRYADTESIFEIVKYSVI